MIKSHKSVIALLLVPIFLSACSGMANKEYKSYNSSSNLYSFSYPAYLNLYKPNLGKMANNAMAGMRGISPNKEIRDDMFLHYTKYGEKPAQFIFLTIERFNPKVKYSGLDPKNWNPKTMKKIDINGKEATLERLMPASLVGGMDNYSARALLKDYYVTAMIMCIPNNPKFNIDTMINIMKSLKFNDQGR